ncbi:uncharacterized protein TEOVI_000738700 [Trypanosoma equiperdum]|uniref:Spermidine synthase n=1 Tax=Trypanosoma equiperdum TaxID=5694 RepID=A0A1G4I6K1_TRYEQ|nr:hypothetical protein, conserved [Trypanosoma equiperdum]
MVGKVEVIPNEDIVVGVKNEILRVYPFWKALVELRAMCKRKPALVSCNVRLLDREPCEIFSGVDVVWMRSDIVVSTRRTGTPGTVDIQGGVQCDEEVFGFGSMHFVHRDAHITGDDGSYNLQSVVFFQRQEQMQCVAGYMLHFAFLTHGMMQRCGVHEDEGSGRASFPSATTKVLILGMGGNSMEFGLRHILGVKAHISIVEIEPAVVRTCRRNNLLDDNPNTHIHVKTVEEALLDCPDDFNFIFMDVFEPKTGKMVNSHKLIEKAFAKLAPEGLLVMNEHCIPTASKLRELFRHIGTKCLQYINVKGWNESVITASKMGETRSEGTKLYSKALAESVLHSYNAAFPGWMPTYTWIERTRGYTIKNGDEKLFVRQWVT